MIDQVISQLGSNLAARILKQPNRQIGPDEPLISSGLIDSFRLVDVGLFVEDAFGVRIDDTELNSGTFDTLRQLALLIEGKRKR